MLGLTQADTKFDPNQPKHNRAIYTCFNIGDDYIRELGCIYQKQHKLMHIYIALIVVLKTIKYL